MDEPVDGRPAAELLALLDEERQALREGALDRVLHLNAGKNAAVERIDARRTPPEALTAIEAAASRNATLLAASAQGILAVIARLRDMQSAGGGTTYGPDGRLRSPRPGSLSRRL